MPCNSGGEYSPPAGFLAFGLMVLELSAAVLNRTHCFKLGEIALL